MEEFSKSKIEEESGKRNKELWDIVREFKAFDNGSSNFSHITGNLIFHGTVLGGEEFKKSKLYLEKYRELLNFSEEFRNFELNNDICI